MKRIPLSQGQFALVDDNDYESVSRFKWYVSRGYARMSVSFGTLDGKQQQVGMFLHRLIMRPPHHLDIDHINHDGLDCRRENMRVCTASQNQHNQVRRKGTSKFKGVSQNKGRSKWRAQIKLNGKQIYLGYFHNEAEAGMAYDAKAKELFGDFANLNFPNSSGLKIRKARRRS